VDQVPISLKVVLVTPAESRHLAAVKGELELSREKIVALELGPEVQTAPFE